MAPTVTDNDDAVVTLTALPTIAVDKTATPLTRTAPGGDFTFNVVVTNTSTEVLTITSLTDDVYGNITTRANSTCNTAIGTVLQPGGTYYLCLHRTVQRRGGVQPDRRGHGAGHQPGRRRGHRQRRRHRQPHRRAHHRGEQDGHPPDPARARR